ncbi:uncharacterized protein SPPG_09065 [Spizellomyces punctatus DAOM BR117]|uniref:Uncharacterized protein n=1 Tax=Spizellomyces punctatus (strain DAOM BR117) TaxID=645134 RepID=A0A0L0HN95_SPIPD|nr:uncharacterized protein SPPG_09065 [Spizellomyces punctatus DAOM BR117]KND02410.1 hypothetical protein SPPG_09065 [Spizellomyces punctatus DAOM BR117]|eukprot:XP_016610449.1 hypothetical protein SPPG_09065 [Spizellomyces punctatus DAOM BR117]
MTHKSLREFEVPAPPRAPGVPLEPDPPRLSELGIERDPAVASLAEYGRGPPAAEEAKHHEHERNLHLDHKLQPNAGVDNREARYHTRRHRTH